MSQVSPFRETALALLEAEEKGNQAQALRESLIANVNPSFLIDFVTVCVGVLAFQTEESPRSIYEQLFSGCPTDETWREMVEGWKGDDE